MTWRLLACASVLVFQAFGQYTVSIVAGGGPPNGVPATAVALSSVNGVAVDTEGNAYVAAGTQNRIYKIATNGSLSTVAGNGTQGFAGDGGPATGAQLSNPNDVAVDVAGNVYIADGCRVRKVASGVIVTIAGTGACGSSGDFGLAINAQLGSGLRVSVDGAGDVYIAEGSRIRRVSGGSIYPVAGTGTPGYLDGLATNAQFSYVNDISAYGVGNLYIADTGNCRIRKVSGGIVSTVAGTGVCGYAGDGGPAVSARINPYGVGADSAGDFYIADAYNARVRKVAGGIISTVAGTGVYGYAGDGGPAASAQLSYPISVAANGAGKFYIADYGNYRIRKVSSAVISTIAGNGSFEYYGDGGPATSAQLNPGGLAVANGTLHIADQQDYRVRRVSGGVISTAAGMGIYGYSGDGGPATNARISTVNGLAADIAGNLYIADGNNNRIRKVAGGLISTMAGTGVCGYSGDGGLAINAQLCSPLDIAIDSSGSIYIAQQDRIRKISGGVISPIAGGGPLDGVTATSISVGSVRGVAIDATGNTYIPVENQHRVFKVAMNGIITVIAGQGTAGFSGDGGLATAAQLSGPAGVAVDSAGNIYIADSGNSRIRKVSGGIISTVAGGGSGCPQQTNPVGDNCTGPSAYLSYPRGVAVDNAGNLYIADTYNCRIRKVVGGVISTVAGTGECGYSGDGGPPASTQLSYPNGVAADAAGANLYIADTNNCRVRKVAGGIISTVAGTGECGYSGDGGPPASTQLSYPDGVAADAAGANLYIADTYNCRVLKVAGGAISRVAGAGTGVCGYSGDGGPATAGQLNAPSGVGVDAAGANLYIADTNNYRIRKVSPAAVISTIAGNGFYSYSGDGGPATGAQFSNPSGLAVDNVGNLYIGDSGNNRVRVVSSAGTITTFAGKGTCGDALGDGGPATGASVCSPGKLAVDSAQNVYIADRGNRLLRRVSGGLISTVTTIAGMGSYPFPGDGGVAVSSAGIYIADPPDNRVRLLTPNGTAPVLSITKTHSGNFWRGQQNATYTITVSNAPSAGPTTGLVTVRDLVPAGLTLVSMAGTGWNCVSNTCTRSNLLSPGASYPPITVTVNVDSTAAETVINEATVSTGTAVGAGASDATSILSVAPGIQTSRVGVFGNGCWYLSNDSGGIYRFWCFGQPGDIPVVGDWDGNGTTNIGVFRNGYWYLANDTGGIYRFWGFGQTGDIPVVGDWDGNGTTDIGVFRNGYWYLANGAGGIYRFWGLGQPGDIPVMGDWDGNGTTDIGVFRDGYWYLANGTGGIYRFWGLGQTGDTPVVGDWDADGTANIGVFRNGYWYLLNDSGRIYRFIGFGQATNLPMIGRW